MAVPVAPGFPQTTEPAEKDETEELVGSVSLKIHINMGSYNNFEIGVEGATGEHARQLIVQESEKMLPIVEGIIKEAMKAAERLKLRYHG